MRDLIVTENITLDGVIDATEGWFNPAGDDDVDQLDVIAAIREQREAADALLLGRVTFEQMRGYWPLQTDDTTGITDYLNHVSKCVVSSTLQDPQWEHTAVLQGTLACGVRSGGGADPRSRASRHTAATLPPRRRSGVAQLRRQRHAPRTRALPVRRPPGGDPAPQRPLAHAHAGCRPADLAWAKLPALSSGGPLGDELTHGCLSQRIAIVLVFARPTHLDRPSADATLRLRQCARRGRVSGSSRLRVGSCP